MKSKNKIFLIALLACLMCQTEAVAETDVKRTLVDGVYYRLNPQSGTAKVVAGDRHDIQNHKDGFYTGAVSIPEKFVYDGLEYTTTEVGDSAFLGSFWLESVDLPQSIVKIGKDAFTGAGGKPYVNNYFTVNLPESIQAIGEGAFKYANVEEIKWPPSVNTVAAHMFYGSSVKKITLPDGVVSIGAYALAELNYATSLYIDVRIPRNVADIGEKAFLNSYINQLYVECDNPPMIAMDALDGYEDRDMIWHGVQFLRVLWKDEEYYRTTEPWCKCYEIKFFDGTMDDPYFDRTHPVEVDGILYYLNPKFLLASVAPGWNFESNTPDSEFYQGDIVVPDCIEYGGVPYRVSTIEPSAFMGTTGLNSATLPEGMVYVGENAFSGSGLRSIRWPSTAREIGAGSFSSTLLSWIDIPDGVIEIGGKAFADCRQLSAASFPSTMERIRSNAFSNGLFTIYTYSDTPPSLDGSVFGKDEWETYAYATVYVPCGCIQKYGNSDWYRFENFIEMSEGSVESVEICDDTEIYTLDGRRVNNDDFNNTSLPHGVYVVRSEGKVRKVMK